MAGTGRWRMDDGIEDGGLIHELISLRDRLREEGRSRTGRTPNVCSDEACREMVRLRPAKPSDFSVIPGLGRSFEENYATRFLKILNGGSVDGSGVEMCRSVEFALQELEKKLVNISRSNRLLFMPRVRNPKEVFDLHLLSHQADVLSPLFDRGACVTIAVPKMRSAEGKPAEYHRMLSQLQRNIAREIRERGRNDLYVAYPFAEGRLPGERFDIKAPLALFPVEMVRDAGSVSLRFDPDRDIVFNNTLVLGYFKLCRINRPLPENVIAEADRGSFIENVLRFYEAVGLRIEDDGGPEIQRFEGYRDGTFPLYGEGELRLRRNAVIGRFPTYSSSIQKDFIDIIDSGKVSPLVEGLLTGSGNPEMHTADVSERDLRYISDLNSAQEEVLDAMRRSDRLVIQGPPGTGKSQTITNLIAGFADAGRSVLVVSEKKAALDVVYSRLGELSRYAMLIDDVSSKDLFYSQLEAMTEAAIPTDAPSMSPAEASSRIDGIFSYLDSLTRAVHEPCSFGLDPYSMYIQAGNADSSGSPFADSFPQRLLDVGYAEIVRARDRFRRSSAISDMDDCMEMRRMHPWMADMRTDLSTDDIEEAAGDLTSLKAELGAWRSSGFFSKMLNRSRMRERVEEVMSKYWTYYRYGDPAATYLEIDDYLSGLRNYDDFASLNAVYESMGDGERMFYETIRHAADDGAISPNLASDALYRHIINQQIRRFETDNRRLFREISSFEETRKDLNEAFAIKQKAVREETHRRLAGCLSSITGSKRYPEMRKVLEMKRRWSVNKFVGRFDFELFKGIRIWLLTPDVVSEIIPLQTGLFDLVVFDEASQMFVEKGIPSLLRAKKAVIAGDHRQLRPSRLGMGRIGMDEDDMAAEGIVTADMETESLLDMARPTYPGIMLRYHYRSRYEELIAFSNHAFYGGGLMVAPDLESDPDPPIKVHLIEDGIWKDRCNLPEARRVVSLVEEILHCRRNRETVGVITFNSAQMDLIESLLEERCAQDPGFAEIYAAEVSRTERGEDLGLFVKNIENVQGDERDIIVFSIGYARDDSGKLVRNFGWLNQRGGENRLNVAISRARTAVHIVTSFRPSELYVDDMKNEGPRLLKRYLQYCFAVSSGSRSEAGAILRSLSGGAVPENARMSDDGFADSVYESLVRRGLDVDRSIGIGGYTLDMAVRSEGRYVLGIECDGVQDLGRMSPRERDYHRRRYLEAMGWKVYRVWLPAWHKNPDAEMDRITDLAGLRRA